MSISFNRLAQLVKVIISMAVFLTHPLQLYVPIQIITDKVTTCFQLKNIGLVDYTTRIALVVGSKRIASSMNFYIIWLSIAFPNRCSP